MSIDRSYYTNDYNKSTNQQNEKILSKEKENMNQLSARKKEHESIIIGNMEIKQYEEQNQIRNELINREKEDITLNQQIFELTSRIEECKQVSAITEEGLQEKRYDNLREELLKVRSILEDSENDRLKERHGKLSVLQNLIMLTKEKSELEELLAAKQNSKDGKRKEYTRLFEKYEETSKRLKKAHENAANEKEFLQRKYLEELRQMKADYEREFRRVKLESRNLKKSFDEVLARREQEADDTLTEISEINSMKEISEIIGALSKDGICQKDSSGKEILQNLFVEYKKLFERLSVTVNISDNEVESNTKSVIKPLKEERKQLKRKLEEALSKVNEKDSEFKVAEMSLKRQIEDLLSEKKNAFIEMKQSMDDSVTYKEEISELRTTLQSVREMFSKNKAELTVTKESLTRTSNELQTLDAEHLKIKRSLAVKDAEISRLQQDLMIEQEKYTSERAQAQKYSNDVIEKMKQIAENEINKSVFQDKVCSGVFQDKINELEQELNALKHKNNRMSTELKKVNEENSELLNEVMERKSLCGQHDILITSLKAQKASTEESLKDKIESTSNSTLQCENLNKELLATKQLLNDQETKSTEQNQQIDKLSKEIMNLTDTLNQSQGEKNDLKTELQRLKVEKASTEESLRDKIESTSNSTLQCENLNKELLATKQLLNDQETMSTEQNQQIDKLSKEIMNLTNTLNQSQEEKNDLETELQRLKDILAEMEKASTEESLKDKIESTSNSTLQCENLNKELLATKQLLNDQETMSTEQNQQIDKLSKEIMNLTNTLNQSQGEKNDLKTELQRLKDILSEMEKPSNREKSHPSTEETVEIKELEELRMRNEELRMRNKELMDQQKRLSKSQEALNTSLVDEIATRKDTQNESKILKQQINEQDEIIKQLKASIVKGEVVTCELQNVLASKEEQFETLKKENEGLQKEIQQVLKVLQNVDDDGKQLSPTATDVTPITTPHTEGVLLGALDNMMSRIQSKKEKDSLKAVEETITVADNESQVFAANEGFQEDLDWLLKNEDGGHGKGREGKQKTPVEGEQQIQLQEQQQQLENLENEKNQHWKESIEKDGEIKTLKKTLEQLGGEKKVLEGEIKRLEKEMIESKLARIPIKDNIEEELNATQEQLQMEREEKDEAVDCLKTLVVDNEVYGNCIKDQQQLIASLKKENKDLTRKMNDTIEAFDREHEEFLKTKQKLQGVMETTLNRESNLSFRQKHEIERLKLELENLKNERQQLRIQLEDKKYELDKTNEDMTCLRSSVGYNLGGIDAEKRTKDFMEEQLRLVVQDRGQTLQKLRSTELLNKMLQNKIKELQKWHNQMEINLLRSCDFHLLQPGNDVKMIVTDSEIPSPTLSDQS